MRQQSSHGRWVPVGLAVSRLVLCLLALPLLFVVCHTNDNDNHLLAHDEVGSETRSRVPDSCRLVMAPSSITDAGWGVFSTVDRLEGEVVMAGEIVLQVPDVNASHADGMQKLIHDYAWDSQETGGHYEGLSVLSLIPGLGMLANGSPKHFQVLPGLRLAVDEGGATRYNSPGAGAFSHYHNYTYYLQRDIQAGDEILLSYGPKWFDQGRRDRTNSDGANDGPPQQRARQLYRSTTTLQEVGYCLDNLCPGPSTLPHAGRGAFATRDLPKGSIVAPVPVVPITKQGTFDITRLREETQHHADGTTYTASTMARTRQLLQNYVYSHVNSSLSFFPYSPVVNFINHDSKPNVRLQWSSGTETSGALNLTLEQFKRRYNNYQNVSLASSVNDLSTPLGLLLELVADVDIAQGDELFLDYGVEWQQSWERHVAGWSPPPMSESTNDGGQKKGRYFPAFVMNQALPVLGTQAELKEQSPYPDHVFTSCFYRYADYGVNTSTLGETITTNVWRETPGLQAVRYLRPCTVMQRFAEPSGSKKNHPALMQYTVVMRNRYGLTRDERIPAGQMHVVTNVPRRAIQFSDKIYTTDQHLESAFRHWIGFADDRMFPQQWRDLAI